MPGARHFSKPASDDQLKAEITADISAARGAQRDLQQAGQYGAAARMGQAADDALDELNDANNGTWKPRHA